MELLTVSRSPISMVLACEPCGSTAILSSTNLRKASIWSRRIFHPWSASSLYTSDTTAFCDLSVMSGDLSHTFTIDAVFDFGLMTALMFLFASASSNDWTTSSITVEPSFLLCSSNASYDAQYNAFLFALMFWIPHFIVSTIFSKFCGSWNAFLCPDAYAVLIASEPCPLAFPMIQETISFAGFNAFPARGNAADTAAHVVMSPRSAPGVIAV